MVRPLGLASSFHNTVCGVKLIATTENSSKTIPRHLHQTPRSIQYQHVSEVFRVAEENSRNAAKYYSGDREHFVENIKAAALYHDLGKVDKENQDVLMVESKKSLPIAHEDAGVANLLNLKMIESAVLAMAHHKGLFSQENERSKGDNPFRNLNVLQHVNLHLKDYEQRHESVGLPILHEITSTDLFDKCGFARRIALSCLVDADYFDTAQHYGHENEFKSTQTKWSERIVALD